jgi:DNA replication protein DnaC
MTASPHSLGTLLSELLARGDLADFDPWRARLAPQERGERYRRLAQQLGYRYSRCDLANYTVREETCTEKRPSQRKVFEAVASFCMDIEARVRTGGGLLLFGRPGGGKDHLMVGALYWALLRHGFTVEWVDGLNLYQRARALVATGGDERAFIEQYTAAQILAISDPVPPKGDVSQYATDVVQRIVDRRYRDCRSTWATLNVHNGAEAEARLASPIIDRLRHEATCLECNWPSYRKPAGTEA